MIKADIAIAGAGIAGAGLAVELAPHASVVVIEMEAQPGYHATGRSAAFWSETYGGPGIQPLTTASGPILQAGGYLAPLGSLHIARASEGAAVDAFLADFADTTVELSRCDPLAMLPGLRPEWTLGVLEPSCAYIDVAALHGDTLAAMRRAGCTLMTDAEILSAARQNGRWRIETKAGPVDAGILVDAAGAWADVLALRARVRPIGIQPYRRTMAQIRVDPPVPDALPHVAAIDGSFYFKPEAGGRLWLSPHDETAVEPCDAQPEEIDVAVAIDRLEHAFDWKVTALERPWAGLRSFVPDRLPVFGHDPDVPGFFWCAGQGGFGIQTAPAAAMLAAALLLNRPMPEQIASIDPAPYMPERFLSLAR